MHEWLDKLISLQEGRMAAIRQRLTFRIASKNGRRRSKSKRSLLLLIHRPLKISTGVVQVFCDLRQNISFIQNIKFW